MKPKLATKVGLITVCKGESSVGYKIVLPTSALRNVNGVHACAKMAVFPNSLVT